LSQLTEKGENTENLSLDFLLSLQEFIIENCNNKDFWIKIDRENIKKFIVYIEKEYQNVKNNFKNNNEIKNKLIQSLVKKSNKTFNIKKTLHNYKECESPAPTIEN